MRTPLYIYILLVILSCKKPEESEYWTEVHVNATNYVTSEPLDDIYIAIIEKKQKFFDSEITSISEGFTDSNGEYYFGWKAKRNSKYSYEYVAQADPGKYYQIYFQQIDYLQKGSQKIYNIDLVTYGYLKLDIQNIACFDSADKLIFKRENLSIPDGLNENWSTERIGCYTYMSPEYFPVPIGNNRYTWRVTKNNITTEFSNSIIVGESDSLVFQMYY